MEDDNLVYVVIVDDKNMGLRARPKVYMTWEEADKEAARVCQEVKMTTRIMGFPDPRTTATLTL